jgi:hypothetical protein
MLWWKRQTKPAKARPMLSSNMPEISADYPLIDRLIVKLLIPDPTITRKVSLYRTNIVRLSDKAILEYNLAREAFLAPLQEMPFIAFMNHMENCVDATARMFKLLGKLESDKTSPPVPQLYLERLATTKRSVTDFRNAIEHIDKEIWKELIPDGKPMSVAVNVSKDGVSISKWNISFRDLAETLQGFNQVGRFLLGLPDGVAVPSDTKGKAP